MVAAPSRSDSSSSSSFEEVIREGCLRECLVTATGKGVRIGILDSGVDSRHPILEGRVVGNYEVIEDRLGEPGVVNLEHGYDVMDHGTANAYIIRQHAPDAELHSIRVIDPTHNSTSLKFVTALEFALEQGWDILNLSLGTDSRYAEIARLADLAYYQNMLWVAAKHNERDKIGYPAALSSVVGVGMDYFESFEEFRYYPDRVIEVEASGVYIEAPRANGGWQQYTGTSFACPQITGMVAQLRECFPDLTPFQLKTALLALRQNRD
ncbi:MAG: S8 family serine peptidase [Verrucomicrobiota bacterium]